MRPYGPDQTQRRTIEVRGEALTFVVPKWLPEIEAVTASKQDDLVFVLGRIRAPKEWGVAGNGALLVGRRRDDGS